MVLNDLGSQLRSARLARGLSLREMAALVHYTKGYLSKIETGQRMPPEELARQYDSVLETGGRFTAIVRNRPRTPSSPEGVEQLMGLRAPMMDAARSAWWDGTDQYLAASADIVVSMPLATIDQARSGAARQTAALDTFDKIFASLRELGQQASPEIVIPPLLAHTQALRRLAVVADDRHRMAALRLAARCAEYTGWMAQEAGRDQVSLWWTAQAIDMAEGSGDHEFAAFGLIRKALVTLYQGDAAQTVELAEQAARHTAARRRVRGLAIQRAAQGHALAGAELEARRALDEARQLLTSDPDEERQHVLGSSTMRDNSDLIEAWCLHDLGRPSDAGALLDAQLNMAPRSAGRFMARWGARRALAYAVSGEVDHACQLARDVVEHALLVDSATVRADLRSLRAALSRWRSHPPVQELLPLITASIRSPWPVSGQV